MQDYNKISKVDDEWLVVVFCRLYFGRDRTLMTTRNEASDRRPVETLRRQHLVSTVGSLLSSPSSFLFLRMFIFILFYFSEETRRKKINKRYEEVDGVRKEKERLTNDHRSLIFTFHLLSSTILSNPSFVLFYFLFFAVENKMK